MPIAPPGPFNLTSNWVDLDAFLEWTMSAISDNSGGVTFDVFRSAAINMSDAIEVCSNIPDTDPLECTDEEPPLLPEIKEVLP